MDKISSKTQIAKIRNFESGFMATHLINIGNKLGIFEKLNSNEEGFDVSDLADSLNLHEPFLKVWCQTAYHFEIVNCDEKSRFTLQPFLNEILGDKSHFKNYLANITMDVELIGNKIFGADTEIVNLFRTGNVLDAEYTPDISDMVYTTTKNIVLAFIFMILPNDEKLKQQFEQGIRLLDIGCGNGSFIIQLAQGFPNSRFVGIGSDVNGIEAAKFTIEQSGLEDRVSVEHIGGETLPFKDEFDLVSMVVTLHEILPGIRLGVVEKAYQALKKGGKLLILDFPYPCKISEFRDARFEYGILDQFYEMCAGTEHLNSKEQSEILLKVGFNNIQRIPIGKGMLEFVLAIK